MTVDPAADALLPAGRAERELPPREPRIIGLDEYCRLLLARRPIDRLHRGVPRGFRGLRDPRTGQTWLIREDALHLVS